MNIFLVEFQNQSSWQIFVVLLDESSAVKSLKEEKIVIYSIALGGGCFFIAGLTVFLIIKVIETWTK